MWTALASLFTIIITLMAAYNKATNLTSKEKEDVDKEIDNAKSATDLFRLFDKLRNK